ncbi:hypothetical protein Goari_008724 [Gossypium aridum]|uniref:Uncharacterized protein n=1 Tax=Gossypium aridum TaxID=34290 RepID=A0A7J8XUS1_GOSAI|nr:hypothetical protein [Gossypium aridum]
MNTEPRRKSACLTTRRFGTLQRMPTSLNFPSGQRVFEILCQSQTTL